MKFFLMVLMILHFNFTLNAQSFFDTSYFQNGKIFIYGKFDENKKCWLKYRYYHSGNICEIDQYDSPDFKNNYSLKGFNIDGSVAVNFSSYRGLPTGIFEQYYSNGMIKIHGQYYNGFKSGKWTEYFPTGEIEMEYLYKISKEDSLFDKRMTLTNQDSFPTSLEQKIEWGEDDPSKEGALRYMNITQFYFHYLRSKEKVFWKKYDRNGKLIDSNISSETE